MPLQVVIPVEGLRAYVAFERSILLAALLSIHMREMMARVRSISWRHAHSPNSRDERHLSTRIPNIRHDWSGDIWKPMIRVGVSRRWPCATIA